eukprot:TRINITY_DN67686_c0_g1_i1.p1 TRINITY_DN67686_c0_g1~~TRINITY_DN67686_c0_g1_i1.p1  ORF type:complete len:489 (-),score=44.72 TRINITY_DN67686_c0_g1_i1:145-1611(-)
MAFRWAWVRLVLAAGFFCRTRCTTVSDLSIPIGCFVSGWLDEDANESPLNPVSTVEKCRQLCVDDPNCKVFTFQPASHICHIGKGDLGQNLVQGAEGDVSGPRVCKQPADACTANVTGQFPGATYVDSFNAWPMAFQPQEGQCWGKESSGKYTSCPDVVGLEDFSGVQHCSGLTVKEGIRWMECENDCKANVLCSLWSIVDSACYQGLGVDCALGEARGTGGARIMHGSYRVLKKLVEKKLDGLVAVFSKANAALLPDPITSCRNLCLSSLPCQYWQLLQETGCWIEHSGNRVPYPLLEGSLTIVVAPERVIDGEYIQRFCPSSQPQLTPELATSSSEISVATEETDGTSSETSVGWPWWVWTLAGLLLFICLMSVVIAIFYLFLHDTEEISQKTRSVMNEQLEDSVQTAQQMQAQPSLLQVMTAPPMQTQSVYIVPQHPPLSTVSAQIPLYQTIQPPSPHSSLLVPAYRHVQPVPQYVMIQQPQVRP